MGGPVGSGVGRGMSQQLGQRSLTLGAYSHQPKLPLSGIVAPHPEPSWNWHVHAGCAWHAQ
jgi:hypothetical protein